MGPIPGAMISSPMKVLDRSTILGPDSIRLWPFIEKQPWNPERPTTHVQHSKMANTSSGCIVETDDWASFRHLAETMLSPGLCKLFIHHLNELRATGVDDPASLSRVLAQLCRLSTLECPREVEKNIGKAVLADTSPVVVFFDCLHTPEELEKMLFDRDMNTAASLTRSYKDAFYSFKALSIAHERADMIQRFWDPIQHKLLLFQNRSLFDKVADSQKGWWRLVVDELVSIGASIRSGTDIRQEYPAYSERTCRLLEYFRWLASGRKDSGCPVTKCWDTRGHQVVELGTPPHLDLSRLPLCRSDLERQVYCQETKKIHRLASLLTLSHTQYLLSTLSTSRPLHRVTKEDGINKATLDGPGYSYAQCLYAGVGPHLDLFLPEVQGAIHAFCCCEIMKSAEALFQYFFNEQSTAKIKFMNFVPRNVHTPLMSIKHNWPNSNMLPYHTVAVVTTQSGLKFVLDPTAAQYGWRETIAPLDIYTRCRVDRKHRSEHLVPLDPNRLPTVRTPRPDKENREARSSWKRRCTAEYIVDQVKGHIPNRDLGALIELPQGQFDKYCQLLDEYLSSTMGMYSKPGAPSVLKAPRRGFRDVVWGGERLYIARPLGTFVIEYHFFKLVAAEAAVQLAKRLQVMGRGVGGIGKITIRNDY
ncbi:2-methylcitrate dehydratase [Diaporthe helianthi]|uniref:2-methylcitrate dehydratase n=1 Tax=Diaporthe helianthi TaxID=158607 RepID=A0A2P5HQ76_DIAHE|nr:2-methylcitrate dehydratase [Diaporthe helianthi]